MDKASGRQVSAASGLKPAILGSSEGELTVTPMPSAEPLRTVHSPKAKKVNPAPKQRWWLTLVVLAVVGGGGYYYWPRLKPLVAKLTAERAAPAPPPARIIPVVTAVARPADLNLYLNGLGTVTGFKTVTVRSRVEGELIKVNFTEGQMVEEGDLLAEIDPRPFEVLLKELEAQLLKSNLGAGCGCAPSPPVTKKS